MPIRKIPRVILVNRCFVMLERRGPILLLLRNPGDKSSSEKWEVPGGKLARGQDLYTSRDREIREETGLEVAPISPFLYSRSHVIDSGRYAGTAYVALYSIARVTGGVFCLSNEHQAHVWVEYKKMFSYDLRDDVRDAAEHLRPLLE
jgi:8-oxo-dGTP pyrophosphatase MutT (NUDIX family)